MNNLNLIRNKITTPNGYVIIPVSLIDTPLPFSEWEIQIYDTDTDEYVGSGEYYSIRKISEKLNSVFKITYVLNNNFIALRYGLDWDTINRVETHLTSAGLNNVRKNNDDTYKLVTDIDFTSFAGNEFMIIPKHMITDIPVTTISETVE